MQLEWWRVVVGLNCWLTELCRANSAGWFANVCSSPADLRGTQALCKLLPPPSFLAVSPPTFSQLWKEDSELTFPLVPAVCSGNIKVLLCCLVLSEHPPLATASPGFHRVFREEQIKRGKYSNAGASRLCSRTKRLLYPSDVGKENLTDPWCISPEPGSCCSQRDLTPLWHRRARGKFLLSARGSSGRLTFTSLRRQHQKVVSSVFEEGAGRQTNMEKAKGALGCSVCKWYQCTSIPYLNLRGCLPVEQGLNPPLFCIDSGLGHFFRTLSSVSLCDSALCCMERLSELWFPICKMGVIFPFSLPLFSLQGSWD